MKTLLLSAIVLLLAPAARAGDEIAVGQPLPALTDVNWLQGEPIKEWKQGEIYVLDFWATWCPPCRKSIPHINEISKKHAADKVNVIGVAVFPRDNMKPTKDYIAEQGDGMAYPIAEDIDAKTADVLMDGSFSNSIPTVMIVDRQGKLAWLGNPLSPPGAMDEALANIIAGKHDLAAAATADQKRRDEARSEFAKQDKYKRLSKAAQAKDWPTALAVADELLAEDATDLTAVSLKYRLLNDSGDKAGAKAFGMAQVTGALKDKAEQLNGLAWMIVDPRSKIAAPDRDLDLALAAATRADELTKHADASTIDTLARTHFLKGDVTKAVELQQKAVAAAKTDEEKSQLQKTLDEYLKQSPAPAGG